MSKVRFGLIGLGIHGQRYARHLLYDIPEAELYAICRQDPLKGEAFAREHNLRYYREYYDLLGDPHIDAVVVVTPPYLNERICTTAVSAGKAVLVEKPLACNTRQAVNILEAVARSGALLMVAHTLRFNSVVRTLEDHLDTIGPIHTISINQRLEPSPRAWMDDVAQAGGGVILHTGVHIFDLVRYFSGDEVQRVYCEVDRVVYSRLEDAFVALLRLRRHHIHCLVDAARYTGGRSGRIEIVGEKGQLLGDHVHGFAMTLVGRQAVPLAVPPPVHTVEQALRAFIRAFRTGEPPPITALDGVQAVEIAEACYHSASSGEAVALEDEESESDGMDEEDELWLHE
ncbi:MAG: oxidoreductase [Candidatus Tectimicrobiota bacterium]|nr:MAG: oxidoreductase [Candidatus Tectomicrobia bacterium]